MRFDVKKLSIEKRRQIQEQYPDIPPHCLGLPTKQKDPSSVAGYTKPRKYNNVKVVTEDGEQFDSKLEARVYERLCKEFGKDRILRQVSIPLAPKTRMMPDFLIIHEVYEDGTFRGEFRDAKGYATEAWALKAKWLLEKHKIPIRLEKK